MDNEHKPGITILVVALGAWGKGKTYEQALDNCIKEGGRQNAHNFHVVYACTDPGVTVNDRGGIEYKAGSENQKILALRFGRNFKPRKEG